MSLEPVHETNGSVVLTRDTSAARWIQERLAPWDRNGVSVGAVVPKGFDAYARIFHPVGRNRQGVTERIRWATVASWNGRTVHPEMQFDRIANPQGQNDSPDWDYPPQEGNLPREDAERLASLLRPHTTTQDGFWFCVWEGYGYFDAKRYRDLPRVTVPQRSYVLYRGPLDAVTSFHWGWIWQSPNLWWPDDHAWCVATEIDLPETYVGGSQACIDAILSDDHLESIQTRSDARVDINADTVNPPVEGPRD